MVVFFALSRCISISKRGRTMMYEFHFKGVYSGQRVDRIICKSDKKLEIVEGNEYILKLRFLSIKKTDLIGYVKKFVKLEEISY
ncbi:MAG: hypothetical protein CME68_11390 [Halobacteriovoraceae bacterium]|nr:hypothetical protein [Halobacteriovoraceae bacterium]